MSGQGQEISNKNTIVKKNQKNKEQEKKQKAPDTFTDPIYKNFQGVLKNAQYGKVVTRFPPEPSGFLHIGHVKASMLNYHYSKIYGGKMILRFDDTNPTKENVEFVDQIQNDLKTLQIYPDRIEYASDFHPVVQGFMTFLIQRGKMYACGLPPQQIKEQRDQGIDSPFREATVEENMARWHEMLKGTETGKKFCIRARLNMRDKVKCMRDPVMYRCNDAPHHRTGTRFKAYPMYDFSCPIVDSLEGVTHALRTIEYRDRYKLYEWIQQICGLRKVELYEFSRLNFKNTLMSKRKLQKLVDNGFVEGWNDPRYPTVQGIMRRGMTIQALKEFMLAQGPSKNNNFMEWDKIWAQNMKILDPVTPRYTAIEKDNICHLYMDKVPGLQNGEHYSESKPIHPKNTELGEKMVLYFGHLLVDYNDLKTVKKGDKLTLMKWGNCIITDISLNPTNEKEIVAYADYLPDDQDFKKNAKINWLAAVDDAMFEFKIREFGHIITKPKPEENDELDEILNMNSKIQYQAIGEGYLRNLKQGDIIQLERRGFFFCDSSFVQNKSELVLHFIPDGKNKAMSQLGSKIDPELLAKGSKQGGQDEKKAEQGKAEEEGGEGDGEKKLSKKELKKQQRKAEKDKKKAEAKKAKEDGGDEIKKD